MKVLLVALCGVLLLGGCATAQPEPTATPRPVASAPAPEDSYPAPDPDYMDAVIAKLGPVPPGDTYTPEQSEAARLADTDVLWDTVTRSFPDEPRPEYAVVRQIENDEYVETMVPCLEDRGISVTVREGGLGFDVVGATAKVLVGTYLCQAEYPVRPRPPFTPAQLGYLYDYFVQFKGPCMSELGYHLAPPAKPPTKETFVANWPRQNYNPSPAEIDNAELAALDLACPNFPEGMR